MARFSIGYAPSLRLGCPPPCQRELTVRCLGGPAHGGGPFICLKDTCARSESKPVNHPFWARELPDNKRSLNSYSFRSTSYPYGNKGVPKPPAVRLRHYPARCAVEGCQAWIKPRRM